MGHGFMSWIQALISLEQQDMERSKDILEASEALAKEHAQPPESTLATAGRWLQGAISWTSGDKDPGPSDGIDSSTIHAELMSAECRFLICVI